MVTSDGQEGPSKSVTNRNGLVDLHMHTSYSSDADHSVWEVLQMAQDLGLRAISISDHDTVEGSRIAVSRGPEYGLEVLPNVEITTFFHGRELHILSYFIDTSATAVVTQLAEIRAFDEARIAEIVARMKNLGVDVEYEEAKALSPNAAPKCSVLIKAAMTNGRNDNLPLFEPYINGSRSDQPYHNFFLDYMRPGGLAYVEPPLRYPSTEAIRLILDYGGIPVLAHPGGSLSCPQEAKIIDILRAHDLSGLEVYSSYHTEADEDFFANYCKRHDLVMTAGSDFHGMTVKPNIRMGNLRHHPYSLVEDLQERRRRVHAM